jgi:hypothetical protein
VVKRLLVLRELGCTFSGPSGAGKTFSISMLSAMLRVDFPRLCIMQYTSGNQQIPSIRAFYKGFLDSVGHPELKGETYDLRARLVRKMASDARQCGMNIVALFIDEANAMTLQDFLFLKDVYNNLEDDRVQMITFMFGQSPDLGFLLERLAMDGRLDLISRFAMREHAIRPYSTLADLEVLFKGIDTIEHCGRPWTEFFVPQNFKRGFRLETQAAVALAAIDAVADRVGGALAFPARQCFAMIRSFLLDAASSDAGTIDNFEDRWKTAVLEAKLEKAMDLIRTQSTARRKKK